MTENEVLGFNPQDLFNNTSNDASNSNPSNSIIYKASPKDSISEDGVYRAKIKIVYNPENPNNSFLEQQSYGMKDKNGFFSVVSPLTVGDKNCPIFISWKKCHFSEKGSMLYNQALPESEGGKGLYDKRFARYVIIQILKDKNKPELVGSFKLWKLPTSIYNLLQQKMSPAKESGKMAIPVMDYLFGRSINLEVHPGPDDKSNPLRKTREISYIGEISDEVVSCINPDGSPLLNDAEQDILDAYVSKISKAWKMVCEDEDEFAERDALVQKVNSSEEYKALLPIYAKVLNNIKEWAPKLDTLSYHEWSPEVKARVNNWIKIVESGNDPETYNGDLLEEGQTNSSDENKYDESQKTSKVEVTSANTETESTDDLPF